MLVAKRGRKKRQANTNETLEIFVCIYASSGKVAEFRELDRKIKKENGKVERRTRMANRKRDIYTN